MQAFVITNNAGMMINADMNVNNWLIKVCVIRGLFGILVNVSASAINLVMLENI